MTFIEVATIPTFYQGYVSLVNSRAVVDALTHSGVETINLLKDIPESKGEFRYEAGKWSIKELICHMMDVERILAYRALRFSRNDKTELHGFEENDYAPEANAHSRTIVALCSEMERLRATTLDLFKSFAPAMLERRGTANKADLSVLALGYIIAGHETHHCNVLKQRYLL